MSDSGCGCNYLKTSLLLMCELGWQDSDSYRTGDFRVEGCLHHGSELETYVERDKERERESKCASKKLYCPL